MKKCRIGDVYGLNTQRGYGLFQVVSIGTTPNDLDLVRVLDGFAKDASDDVSALVAGREQYFLWLPMRINSYRREFEYVGNYAIPQTVVIPHEFRWAIASPDGTINWYRDVPGISRKRETVLNDEYFQLSPYSTPSLPDIVERLENAWRLIDWR